MKRLIPILALLCLALPAKAVTPTVIQWVSTPDMGNTGQTSAANATQTIPFPNATQAGDAIIVYIRYNSGSGWSITDEATSDTFTRGGHCVGNGWNWDTYYVTSGAGGKRVLTAKHTSATINYFGAIALEVNNLTALDVSSCSADINSGTSVSAGSLTPTVTGDFLVQFTGDETAPMFTSGSYTAGSQSNITWKLLASEELSSQGAQVGQYNSTSAINPTMTKPDSGFDFGSVALAFSTGSAGGTLPSGEYVSGLQTGTIQQTSPTTYPLEITPHGTVIVGQVNGGGTDEITGITSTPSATWHIGSICADSNSDTDDYHFWAAGLTPGTTYALSVTMSSTTFDSAIMLFDVVGADPSSPIDTGAGGSCNTGDKTGTTAINTSLTTGGGAATNAAFVPSTASGIVVSGISVDFNTVNAVSTSPGSLLLNGFLSTNSSGNTPYYENDGQASYANSATSGIQFTWSFQSGLGSNIGWWSSDTFNIKPAAGGVARHRAMIQ